MNNQTSFHTDLKEYMDKFIHSIYDCTGTFPKEELFGATSQLRRASLSVVLNYIEGYARQRKAVFKNFIEISYGSLKETKYLLYFSFKRGWIKEKQWMELNQSAETIGKMLWGILRKL